MIDAFGVRISLFREEPFSKANVVVVELFLRQRRSGKVDRRIGVSTFWNRVAHAIVVILSTAALGAETQPASRPGERSNHNDVCDLPTETPLTAPGDCREKPIIAVNYFLSFRGLPDRPIGRPIRYTPEQMVRGCGSWNDERAKEFVIARADSQRGYLCVSPARTIADLKGELNKVNGKSLGSVVLRIDFELMVPDNTFSSESLGCVEITGRKGNQTRTLVEHALYPQIFREPGRFQTNSLLMAQYVPDAVEEVTFAVFWNGKGPLAVRAIEVVPLAFEGFFGGWSSMPWRGGPDTGSHYRQFDPLWIVTSQYNKDGTVSPLERIDWWRRDLLVSHTGYYPYIGPYDQADPRVLRYHVRQARAAGIDAFKVYQYYDTRAGAEKLNETRWQWQSLRALLEVCKEERFAIFLNDSTLSEQTWVGGPYGYDDAVHNFGLVAAAGMLDHAGYLKINGRPVYDLPAIFETDPAKLIDTAARINRKYREITGRGKDVYQLYTPMSTFITRNEDGPFNMQVIFLDHYYLQEDRWQRYFACDPPPKDVPDLLARGRCKYDTTQPASGYCMLLATLLERDHLAGFRRMPGVTGLYDWTALAVPMFPQYLTPVDGRYVFRGVIDPSMSARAYQVYVESAHRHGYAAAVSISPGHDKSGSFAKVDYVIQPRYEDDGRTLIWRRLVRDALAARPDFIMIENWNGYGEAVVIEPCEGFRSDVDGRDDPDIYLRILAEALGLDYNPPSIPPEIVDPIRLPYLPRGRLAGGK